MSRIWTTGLKKARKTASDELESFANSPGDKLEFLLEKVQAHAVPETPEEKVEAYVYSTIAINHHIRHGGLSPQQVRNIFLLANKIIVTASVPASKSHILAERKGELEVLRSQAERRDGNHMQSALGQYLAYNTAGRHIPGGMAFHHFAFGNRLLRIGYAEPAIENFNLAEEKGLDAINIPHCRISKITAQWLLGDRELAQKTLGETWELDGLSERYNFYLEWLEKVLDIGSMQTLMALVNLVYKNSKDVPNNFKIDAYLWAHSWDLSGFRGKRVTPPSKLNLREMTSPTERLYLNAVRALENCHQEKYEEQVLLENLSRFIAESDKFVTIERQILFLAASIRWLYTIKQYTLANMVMGQYRRLSLSLSNYKNLDVLGVLRDLNDRSWATFAKPQEPGAA